MTESTDIVWCYYIEGSSYFTGGFSTKEAALKSAYNEYDGELPSNLNVGTETDPSSMLTFSAEDIAQQISESLDVEDCYAYLYAGAQEALDIWVQTYIGFDAVKICLDGERPTDEEWASAK